MIPIRPAPEPPDFDKRVRRKGLDAIAELVGETPTQKRRGRKRKKIAATRSEIPSEEFPPFWRELLPEIAASYHRICAYSALYIEHTGAPTVDHFVPKSKAWDKVYEWSNYRLACQPINSKKKDIELVLDPFAIAPGLFAMEFVEFQVKPGAAAVGLLLGAVKDVLPILNISDCCAARREYVLRYELGPGNGGIDLPFLERRAPFVAQELRRQGRLLRGDV